MNSVLFAILSMTTMMMAESTFVYNSGSFKIIIETVEKKLDKKDQALMQAEINIALENFYNEYSDGESEDYKDPFILQCYLNETCNTYQYQVNFLVISTDKEYEFSNKISRSNSSARENKNAIDITLNNSAATSESNKQG